MQGLSTELPRGGRAYVATVLLFGVAAVIYAATGLVRQPIQHGWLVLAGLTIVAGSFSIKVPSVSARLSASDAFVFAAILSFGPDVATLIAALEALVLTSWQRAGSRSILRALFNVSTGAISVFISARLFAAMVHTVGPPQDLALQELLVPTAVLAITYFSVNSWLVAVALAFERTASPWLVWRRNFTWLSLNYLAAASLALLVVTYVRNLDLTAVSVVVPLLVIIYLTQRTSLARVEDAQQHVDQLNDLYMSTIETLAMAVDAKDQITHGHIRRVQVYTLELARRLGVTDPSQLKAIEAAALLHDMGKLAIPEHILNKPGKLTAAEFDNMKRHTDIGADLLSSIRFPYPVVPIVRHHHENWDGSGYPGGLSGIDIPVGARILSVVDCFDALTSDRPYRPRLSAEEAFAILRERRGRMYDPIVVDTFIAAYAEIAPIAIAAGQHARSLVPAFEQSQERSANSLRNIRATAAQSSLISEYVRALQRTANFEDAVTVAEEYAKLLTPATACATYKYLPEADILRCVRCSGSGGQLVRGLSIKRGERVTGWAAANRTTIANSQAELDLMEICAAFSPRLNSAMAAPLCGGGDRLIGVLTAYAPTENAFLDSHRYGFERIASLLAEHLDTLTERNTVVRFPNPERR
jgi:putative nucleotidyltransferase with HDIG domain